MDCDSNSDDDDDDLDASDDVVPSECLRLQHAELEMLTSMFPDELTLTDEEAVAIFKSFVENLDDGDDILDAKFPPNLSFDLKVKLDAVGGEDSNETRTNEVELSITYPSLYPRVEPTVMLRTKFPKSQEGRLRRSIDTFLAAQPKGELYVANLIEFVKETVVGVFEMQCEENSKEESLPRSDRPMKMARMWIYSHHIYSMQKRKFILEWARELGLTGFSMPGKPGIVCAEGLESAVDELWTRLRKLNWKRLAIKERETISAAATTTTGGLDDSKSERSGARKFAHFQEISFDVKQGQGRNYHMDMGKFLDFLKTHDCERIFRLYFGVDGNNS